jgi:hypothetical protein
VNRHFSMSDFKHAQPTRLYGSLDHIERGDLHTLAAFDCVDADWLDNQGHDPQFRGYFDGADPPMADHFWCDFWKSLKQSGRNPLDGMPLFRIEVELNSLSHLTSDGYGRDAEDWDPALAAAESTWLYFEVSNVSQSSWFEAQLYHGMFLPPAVVYITARKLEEDSAAKVVLDLMMKSLDELDEPKQSDLEAALKSAKADYLGVWDVGQGNANALLDDGFLAKAWFDIGCGVYRNAWTSPSPLEFCWKDNNAGIVLSHWDADHWAGAEVKTAAGTTPALGRTWIVPVQKVTTLHLTFASSVAASGRMWGLRAASSLVGIGGGRQVTLELGKGSSRNHSGIVMLVENGSSGADRWLLTGDCDYSYMATAHADVLALVAPHHGASLRPSSVVPAPSGGYCRLAYSFGGNNAHGSGTSHPTSAGVTKHHCGGWWHGAWSLAMPATKVAVGDVLATAQHVVGASRKRPPPASSRLDGALIGWTAPPAWGRCPGCPGHCAPPLPQT